ncbi:MAG: sulfurtransferase TusA family protein [Thiothrix sp.]|nr:sulfurtransferase TusA family protein [Thiothrix sp.]HPE61573.1 sulfurtransferase TusA family protein [Thiolinea sp.]
MTDFNAELDARGLNCPLPILRTKKSMNGMAAGEVLKVVATDPGSVKDMEAYARQTGNDLIAATQEGSEYTFFIRKN